MTPIRPKARSARRSGIHRQQKALFGWSSGEGIAVLGAAREPLSRATRILSGYLKDQATKNIWWTVETTLSKYSLSGWNVPKAIVRETVVSQSDNPFDLSRRQSLQRVQEDILFMSGAD